MARPRQVTRYHDDISAIPGFYLTTTLVVEPTKEVREGLKAEVRKCCFQLLQCLRLQSMYASMLQPGYYKVNEYACYLNAHSQLTGLLAVSAAVTYDVQEDTERIWRAYIPEQAERYRTLNPWTRDYLNAGYEGFVHCRSMKDCIEDLGRRYKDLSNDVAVLQQRLPVAARNICLLPSLPPVATPAAFVWPAYIHVSHTSYGGPGLNVCMANSVSPDWSNLSNNSSFQSSDYGSQALVPQSGYGVQGSVDQPGITDPAMLPLDSHLQFLGPPARNDVNGGNQPIFFHKLTVVSHGTQSPPNQELSQTINDSTAPQDVLDASDQALRMALFEEAAFGP